MSKSLDEKKAAQTKALIDQVLEPKIKAIVLAANETLKKKGIQLGVSCEWFMDKLPNKSKEEEEEND